VILGGGIGAIAARQGASLGIPAVFLHFTRKDESEADYLGLQYLYAAGYDPNGAISVLEKFESLQKRAPGKLAQVFSTHPMDAERIEKAEKEIERILPARDEYVVNTSEYRAIRERLINLGKTTRREEESERPTLRRRELVE
jgi:beta-barrel assembly-enhancing protease